jgi:hypothetical protein
MTGSEKRRSSSASDDEVGGLQKRDPPRAERAIEHCEQTPIQKGSIMPRRSINRRKASANGLSCVA